jgi:CRISPR-associated protein Cas2
MKADYLVCYDIASPKRLGRVYRYMKGRGIHIQYSVFHCSLTWPELQRLKAGLNSILDEECDDVRIYPLPAAAKVIVMGCGDRVPEGVKVYV